MNLKSFPGPLPHFNVGGAAVMVGETRGRRGMGCSQTFGGPQHASVEGTPAIEVPKNGAPALSMGAGCPSCLLTPPPPPTHTLFAELSLDRRGAGDGACADRMVSAPLPKPL